MAQKVQFVLLVGYLRTVQYTKQLEGNKNNLVDIIISQLQEGISCAQVLLVGYLRTVGYTQQLEGNKNELEHTICAKVLLVRYLGSVGYSQKVCLCSWEGSICNKVVGYLRIVYPTSTT